MNIINDLTFVIPVYLKNKDDIDALHATLKKLLKLKSKIIVISQGIKTEFNSNHIKNYHSDKSLGKWTAVSYANQFELSDYIFIHDGDNPFKMDSYQNLSKLKGNTLFQRDKILLYAKDEVSRNSRAYIELFLNKYKNFTRSSELDIQSGAYVLKKDLFEDIKFESFGGYGGELAIFDHICKHNIFINTMDMEVEVNNSRLSSNYTIETILKSVILLPISITKALNIINYCIKDYNRYIDNVDEFKYEIFYFLKKYNLIS